MTIRRARRPLPKRIAAAVTAALAALDAHEQSREPLPEGVCAHLRRALERIIGGEANLRNALDTSKKPRAASRRMQCESGKSKPVPDFIARLYLASERSPEWIAFYGVRQALQFMHPTPSERAAIEGIGFAGRIGRPLVEKQLALLRRMLLAAVGGESDAWRAVSLSDANDRAPPRIARALRVLHALVKRKLGMRAGKAAAAVADTWGVEADSVAHDVRRRGNAVRDWLSAYLVAELQPGSRERELLTEIDDALGAPETVKRFRSDATFPATPEALWQFPLPRVG